MNASRNKILFWCLLAAEAAGSQVILWNGIPIYRRLSAGTEGAGSTNFVWAAIVIIVMQVAHWGVSTAATSFSAQRFPGIRAGVRR
jgi:hypothetical protein